MSFAAGTGFGLIALVYNYPGVWWVLLPYLIAVGWVVGDARNTED